MAIKEALVNSIIVAGREQYTKMLPQLKLESRALANISHFLEAITAKPEILFHRMVELEEAIDRFNRAKTSEDIPFLSYNAHTIDHLIGENGSMPSVTRLRNKNVTQLITTQFVHAIQQGFYEFPSSVEDPSQFATCVVLDCAGSGMVNYWRRDRATQERIDAHQLQDGFSIRERATNAVIESLSARDLIFQDAVAMKWITTDYGFDPSFVVQWQ